MKIIKTAFIMGVVACGLLALTPVFAGTSPPDTSEIVGQCESNWNNSSASQSCSSTTFRRKGSSCNLTTTCKRPNGTTTSSITVSPGSASSIWNCNGSLQTSAC